MDDELSDDIYGDLGDFESNEKIKEVRKSIRDSKLKYCRYFVNGYLNQINRLRCPEPDVAF